MKFMGYPEKKLKQFVREEKAMEAQNEADTIIDAGSHKMFAYLVKRGVLEDKTPCPETGKPCEFAHDVRDHYRCIHCGRVPGEDSNSA